MCARCLGMGSCCALHTGCTHLLHISSASHACVCRKVLVSYNTSAGGRLKGICAYMDTKAVQRPAWRERWEASPLSCRASHHVARQEVERRRYLTHARTHACTHTHVHSPGRLFRVFKSPTRWFRSALLEEAECASMCIISTSILIISHKVLCW